LRSRKEREFDWTRLPWTLKKSSPTYLGPKISTLFWCTGWTWYRQIIFRFASIHGRACFIVFLAISDIWLLNLQYISYINCTNNWNHKQLFSLVLCLRENGHIIVEGEFRPRTSKMSNQNICVRRQKLTLHRHMPWSSSY